MIFVEWELNRCTSLNPSRRAKAAARLGVFCQQNQDRARGLLAGVFDKAHWNWLAMLDDPDAEVREAAVGAFARQGDNCLEWAYRALDPECGTSFVRRVNLTDTAVEWFTEQLKGKLKKYESNRRVVQWIECLVGPENAVPIVGQLIWEDVIRFGKSSRHYPTVCEMLKSSPNGFDKVILDRFAALKLEREYKQVGVHKFDEDYAPYVVSGVNVRKGDPIYDWVDVFDPDEIPTLASEILTKREGA